MGRWRVRAVATSIHEFSLQGKARLYEQGAREGVGPFPSHLPLWIPRARARRSSVIR